MAIIPVRGLAKGGIILDQHPTALPLPAFTGGRNVLFDNGKCVRGPVWRSVATALDKASPARVIAARSPGSGFAEVIIGRDDGSLARLHSNTITEASEPGFVPAEFYDFPWTSGFLGGVLYMNRPDAAPRSLRPQDTTFTRLANWPQGWTARVLRPFRDSLVALGVTKSGVESPSTVDVSDVAYYQTVPGSWDSTDASKLAYESPLARLTGPILDGCQLGDRFMIYTSDQVVEMTADSNFIYSFTDMPFTDGVISTNCVVEVDGLHFVFGSRDIWMTDGQTKKSLAENRVKEALYKRIDRSKVNRCFVQFMPTTNTILFAYVSSDSESVWKNPTGCNEGMLYSRTSDTWTIVDLPNVVSTAVADVNSSRTWDTMGDLTWEGFGGSWYDQEDGRNRNLLALSQDLASPGNFSTLSGGGKLIAYDYIDKGRLALPIDDTCTAPSYADRIGISLDVEQDAGVPLVVSKLLRSFYPEISCSRDSGTVSMFATASPTPFGPAVFPREGLSFWPAMDYVVDLMVSGRYLAFRIVFPPDCDCEFSGFDLDVITNGSR